VDLILENKQGQCVGIEVKASSKISSDDTNSLKYLRSILKESFIKGVILYMGETVIPFDKDILAVPMPAVWG
jgi:hypothetical protein